MQHATEPIFLKTNIYKITEPGLVVCTLQRTISQRVAYRAKTATASSTQPPCHLTRT